MAYGRLSVATDPTELNRQGPDTGSQYRSTIFAQDAGQVEVLDAKEVRRDGGLHGSELLLNLKGTDGPPLKWRQVALTDATVSKVHVLVITCDDACYSANEGVIDNIIDSWKVKER